MLSSATGCKSKKAAARAKATAEATQNSKANEAKATLKAIVNGETTWSLQEKEARLNAIKNAGINDAEVSQLIKEAEKRISDERVAAGLDSGKPKVVAADSKPATGTTAVKETTETRLNTLFDRIAAGNNVSESMKEAKAMFKSSDVPVLIIISQSAQITDYDRPTTIDKYLEYLKDQKVSRNKVHSVKYDTDNKIEELELIRK